MLESGNSMGASQHYKTYSVQADYAPFLEERTTVIPGLFFDNVLHTNYLFRFHRILYPPVVGVGQKCNFPIRQMMDLGISFLFSLTFFLTSSGSGSVH